MRGMQGPKISVIFSFTSLCIKMNIQNENGNTEDESRS